MLPIDYLEKEGMVFVMGEKYPLLIADCVIVEKTMYFFTKNYNALFMLDLTSGKQKFLGSLPNENMFGENLIRTIQIWDSRLILVPGRTNDDRIWSYNLKSGEWDNFEIDFKGVKDPWEKVAYSTLYGESLILVGYQYNGIIKINLNSNSAEYYTNILDEDCNIHSLFYCEVDNEKLIIPSPNKNQVTTVNLDSLKVVTYRVGNGDCVYSGICKYKDYYWLSPRGKCQYVVRWNGCEEYQVYNLPDEIEKNGEYIFGGVNRIGNDVYMVGERGKKTLAFTDGDYNKKRIIHQSYVLCKRGKDNEYILQDYAGNISILWNDLSYEFNISSNVDEVFLDKLAEGMNGNLIQENENFNLKMFVNLLSE